MRTAFIVFTAYLAVVWLSGTQTLTITNTGAKLAACVLIIAGSLAFHHYVPTRLPFILEKLRRFYWKVRLKQKTKQEIKKQSDEAVEAFKERIRKQVEEKFNERNASKGV